MTIGVSEAVLLVMGFLTGVCVTLAGLIMWKLRRVN